MFLERRLNLYDLARAELTARLAAWRFQPGARGRACGITSIWGVRRVVGRMPELPAKVRTRLAVECVLAGLPVAHELHSSDGFTRKFLLGLADGRRIETVFDAVHRTRDRLRVESGRMRDGMRILRHGPDGLPTPPHRGRNRRAQAVHLQRLLRSASPDSTSEQRDRNPKPETRNLAEPLSRGSAISCSWAWASRCTTTTR